MQTFISFHQPLHLNFYNSFLCSISLILFSFSTFDTLLTFSFVILVSLSISSFSILMLYSLNLHSTYQTFSINFIVSISSFSFITVMPLKAHPYSLILMTTHSLYYRQLFYILSFHFLHPLIPFIRAYFLIT